MLTNSEKQLIAQAYSFAKANSPSVEQLASMYPELSAQQISDIIAFAIGEQFSYA